MLRAVVTAVALLGLCTGQTLAGEKKIIRPHGAEPGGSWSHGILIDGTLYVSGMGGEDAAGKIPGEFEAEVKQALENIGVVLKEAGMSRTDVVSVQVYLTDGALFDRMNAVYKGYFQDPRPTRTTVVVAKLVGPGHIEITTTPGSSYLGAPNKRNRVFLSRNQFQGARSTKRTREFEQEQNMNTKKRRDQTDILSAEKLNTQDIPVGVDRRAFLMRSALISSVAVMTGCSVSDTEQKVAAAPPPQKAPELSPQLDVVKKAKGPVITTIDEFYKVGPGPSSSHTIGPMRITYDFYQRCAKLPPDQLAKATGMKVHLYGSLSATGKGHGTERAALAGIIGKEPATVDPLFLDSLRDNPDQTFPVKLGSKTFNVSLKDIIYDAPKGDFPHPNTMTAKLMAGDSVLYEQEYYSVGGGFIEWKGYEPPKKGQPKYPYSTMKELLAHAERDKLSVAQVVMANEVAVSGKSEAEVAAFVDKIATVMVTIVKSGLSMPQGVLPGPIKLKTKAGDVYKRAMEDRYEKERGVGVVSAYALAGSEENARGHLVVTAPTGGSAGVLPAIVYALGEGGRGLPKEKIRNGLLAGAAIGYLCKHNATLAGAEGGCQAEIGVASAMGAALIAQAHDQPNQVIANAAESALEHHLGLTCDPVAGFVQVPCIERCAYGAVKAWTGFLIASNEIPANRRVDFDTTVAAMALTAKEMNSKYKETSEGGLAVSVVLC